MPDFLAIDPHGHNPHYTQIAQTVGDNRELRNSMNFDACALRKMSRSGAGCRKMWVAAPQQVTWVRQGHTTQTDYFALKSSSWLLFFSLCRGSARHRCGGIQGVCADPVQLEILTLKSNIILIHHILSNLEVIAAWLAPSRQLSSTDV
jgi:hypothetical protein